MKFGGDKTSNRTGKNQIKIKRQGPDGFDSRPPTGVRTYYRQVLPSHSSHLTTSSHVRNTQDSQYLNLCSTRPSLPTRIPSRQQIETTLRPTPFSYLPDSARSQQRTVPTVRICTTIIVCTPLFSTFMAFILIDLNNT